MVWKDKTNYDDDNEDSGSGTLTGHSDSPFYPCTCHNAHILAFPHLMEENVSTGSSVFYP